MLLPEAIEGPDLIYVGGLPCYFTEAQVREVLESFGALSGLSLMKDRETGNSKGFGFYAYQDSSVTDIACAALNGLKMGENTLTVRRANQGQIQPNLGHNQRSNFSSFTGQIPGATPAVPGMFQNMYSLASSHATRHARRVYVGGLPPSANEQTIATFFSHVMAAIGGNTAGPGNAVVNVYIHHEKNFAFVEMRSVEEASNAISLDGIIFEGAPVKVRRPSDYNPSLAAALGPSQPNPNLNLAAVGLRPGLAGGLQGPDCIFVDGLPNYFTETQVKELLESFGALRVLDFVKGTETGNSRGYAFCVYQDLSATDLACAAFNGIKLGDETLTVRRANRGQINAHLLALQQIALQRLTLEPSTKVLSLTQAVTEEELMNDEDYEDIMEDMKIECGKFGSLVNVVIPRPSPNGGQVTGVGKVFLEYADTESSKKARAGLNGRRFGGNQVVASFYPENKFSEGDYDG